VDHHRGPGWTWNDLGDRDVRRFLKRAYVDRLSPSTIGHQISALRRFHAEVLTSRLDFRGPKRLELLPQCIDQKVMQTILEVAAWHAALTPGWVPLRDLALLELAYSCGPRVRELEQLNRADLTLIASDEMPPGLAGSVALDVGGETEREVRIGRRALQALLMYLEARPLRVGKGCEVDAQAVFVSSDTGGRLNRRQIERIVRRSGDRIIDGYGLTPQVIRASFIVHLLDAGADLRAVQVLAGHTSPLITARYRQLATKRLRAIYNRCHPRAN
jgi:site-specific recombinase XerD